VVTRAQLAGCTGYVRPGRLLPVALALLALAAACGAWWAL